MPFARRLHEDPCNKRVWVLHCTLAEHKLEVVVVVAAEEVDNNLVVEVASSKQIEVAEELRKQQEAEELDVEAKSLVVVAPQQLMAG